MVTPREVAARIARIRCAKRSKHLRTGIDILSRAELDRVLPPYIPTTIKTANGPKRSCASLRPDDIRTILRMHKTGASYDTIADRMQIHKGSLWKICTNKVLKYSHLYEEIYADNSE